MIVLEWNAKDQCSYQGHPVQCISPYLNPAHVLAPPRDWLEAVVQGGFTWEFFRLRYKDLLRRRFREFPEPFFSLLDASAGDQILALTCHCLAGPCHAEVAKDFLDKLRDLAPYQQWIALRHQLTEFPLPMGHLGEKHNPESFTPIGTASVRVSRRSTGHVLQGARSA
jgi:hypothetical protein